MISVARTRRGARAILLAASLCAAVPSVRWCSVRWDEIAPELFLRCAAASAVGSPACAMSFDGRSPAAPRASCRVLGRICGSECAATPSRPRNAQCSSGAGLQSCPLAARTIDDVVGGTVPPAGSPTPTRHGRAYWLGDAGYASALRSLGPELSGPGLAAAPPPAGTDLEGPERRGVRTQVAVDAAPPARPSNRPPPARAPPSEA
jgi:hypothetical protein